MNKTICLVKKDVNHPCGEGNWIIMTYQDYLIWKNGEGKGRKLTRLSSIEGTEDTILIEVDKEEARTIECENKHQYRNYLIWKNKMLSLDVAIDDTEELFLGDSVEDKSINVEELVMTKSIVEETLTIVKQLSTIEQRIFLETIYTDYPITEREFARRNGCSAGYVHKLKVKVLDKIRSALGEE